MSLPNSPKAIFGIFLIFATGVIVGYLIFSWLNTNQTVEKNASKQIREIGEYQYTNPLLECEVATDTIDARKENFDQALENFVGEMKKKHQLSDAAVYFRDLNNGPTFGVNETGEFFPASLLKVPVMMMYYRWAEQEPGLLENKITYEQPKDFGVTLNIKPRKEIIPGETYTVAELIEHMIIYSDNQALALLSERLPRERISDLFQMLGVGEDVVDRLDAKLTVKEYAGFFRILFNSSYLSQEHSEKALALLAKTDYHDALPAGVPTGTIVAHKFGEAGTGDTERQLHDCGIVYFPDHPYLACIMTRGQNLDNLKQSIVDISRFIYEKIDGQY